MIPTSERTVLLSPPATVNNANATCSLLDTQGYRYAVIDVSLGTLAANITALYLRESDTGNVSNSTLTGTISNVTGSIFGTSLNIEGSTSALPTTANANTVFATEIDLRGRRRYLQVVCTAGAGNDLVAITAKLSRPENSPETMAQRGANQTLRIPNL
jgi:hypothetical protein